MDLPSVSPDGGPRSTAEEFNIRGLGDERIVIRVDGARVNFNAGHKGRVFFDPDMLKRVEIIRGPSSIYGSGALGGVVALELRDASDFLQGKERFGLKTKFSLQSGNAEAQYSKTAFARNKHLGAVVSFSRRVSGSVRTGDAGSVDANRSSLVPYSKDNIKSGVAKFTMRPADGHKLFFTFQIYDNNNVIPSAANTATTALVGTRKTREERYVLGWNFKPKSTDWVDLKVRLYTNKTELRERVISPGADFGRTDETNLNTYGVDVYNTSRFDFWGGNAKLAVTYGIEAYRDLQAGQRNGAARAQYPDATQDVFGSYLQAELTLWKQFIILGTLRYDRINSKADGSAGTSEDDLSKSIALGWKPTPWLLIYGKYAEAFRAPSLTEKFASGVHFPLFAGLSNNFLPNPNLKPEDSQSLEGGVAMVFRDVVRKSDRLTAQASVYRQDVKNFIDLQVINNITFTPPFGPFGCAPCSSQSVNIRDARLFGSEITVAYTSPWVFGAIQGSYTMGQNKTTGGSIRSIPAHKLIVNLGTRVPHLDLLVGWRGSFISSQKRTPDGTTPTSGYILNGVYASWVPSGKRLSFLKGFRLDVGVDNIGDVRYRQHLNELPAGGRNFKVAMSYTIKFGGK